MLSSEHRRRDLEAPDGLGVPSPADYETPVGGLPRWLAVRHRDQVVLVDVRHPWVLQGTGDHQVQVSLMRITDIRFNSGFAGLRVHL